MRTGTHDKPDEQPDKHKAFPWADKVRDASNTAKKAKDRLHDATARKAKQLANSTEQVMHRVSHTAGEDYHAIIGQNPLIQSTMSRQDLLVNGQDLLDTIFNIPWMTTLFWSAAAGSTVTLREPLTHTLDQLLHSGPGHIKTWEQINQFIDNGGGGGHRLKFGHSIEYLPEIIEKHGVEAVPAFMVHLAQDIASPAGIPIIPDAWNIKAWLGEHVVSPKVATSLVTMNFAGLLGSLTVVTLVGRLWEFGDVVVKNIKMKGFLQTATEAMSKQDYIAAETNYKHALDIERKPTILMSLGQLHTRRTSTRLYAHQMFTEAVTMLSDRPAATVPYGNARLSIRGLAGIQALATAEVLAGINPEHWNDYVQDLVNATCSSFTLSGNSLARQGHDLIPDKLVAPAYTSAAINFYLAAKAACYYPLTTKRHETVIQNLQCALQSLGHMAQHDEEQLRAPVDVLRELWTRELLPSDEARSLLARY